MEWVFKPFVNQFFIYSRVFIECVCVCVCVCVCKHACSGAIMFPARKHLQNLCYANLFPPSQLTHSIMCKPDVTVQRMNEYVPRSSGFDSMHYKKRALESINVKLKEGILKERKTSVVCRIELVKTKQSIFMHSFIHSLHHYSVEHVLGPSLLVLALD